MEKALEEGIWFAEGLAPGCIEVDNYGAARGIRLQAAPSGKEHWLPAHTVFVAAGTQPNTVLAREEAERFALDGKYFRACDENGEPGEAASAATSKPERAAGAAASRHADGRFMSFFGDLHPSYFGNVVKAMGSAKQGYPGGVARARQRGRPRAARAMCVLRRAEPRQLRATVHEVRAPHADHRRSRAARAGRRAHASIPASSTACRTSKPSRCACRGTTLRWKASR